MNQTLFILCGICAASFALPAAGQAANADASAAEPWHTYKFNGRLQVRADRFDGLYSDSGDTVNALYVRRLDLGMSGRLGRNWTYEIEGEYNDSERKLKAASLSYKGWDGLELVVGRFKPEFGLERTTSSSSITGIERSAIWDLAPDLGDEREGFGVALRGNGARHHYSIDLNRAEGETSASLRAVYRPWLREGRLLHVGLSYAGMGGVSNGDIDSRLGVRGVTVADEGNRSTLGRKLGKDAFGSEHAFGLELAYQRGPFSLQSEWLRRDLGGNSIATGDRHATGATLQLAYTLTGEARRYQADSARFGTVRPADPALGAWELYYRHDRLRVNGEPGLIRPLRSEAQAAVDALGVNWYATRATKVGVGLTLGRTNDIVNDAGDKRGKALSVQAQYQF